MKWSEEDLAAAIENNLYNLWIKAAKVSGNIVATRAELSWVIANNSDWPNCIFGAKINEADVEDKISSVIEQIEVGRLPRFWTVGSKSIPKSLSECLARKGFVKFWNQNGMAIDLRDIHTNMLRSDKLCIENISDVETLKQWSAISDKNFDEKIDLSIREKLFRENDVEYYAGLIEGEIVATSMVFYSCDVAGINFVSTLPEYRKSGIGAAMTLASLNSAYRRGYKVGVLQASPMGVGVYRALGFKDYCKIEYFRFDGQQS